MERFDLEEWKEDIKDCSRSVYGYGQVPEEVWVYALSLYPKLWKNPPHLAERRLWSQEFLKTLVPANGSLAAFVDELDEAMAFAAVKLDPDVLGHLEDRHRENKALLLSVLWREGRVLCHAAQCLRADKEVVLIAVNSDGEALKYATSPLRQDKEVCLAAMRSDNGCAKVISYVHGELRYDKEVACAYLAQHRSWVHDYALRELDTMCGLTEYVTRVDMDYDNLVLFNLGQKEVMRCWSERALETGDRRPAYANIYGQGMGAAGRFNVRILEFLLPCRRMFEEAMSTRSNLAELAARTAEKAALFARADQERFERKELARIRGKYARLC